MKLVFLFGEVGQEKPDCCLNDGKPGSMFSQFYPAFLGNGYDEAFFGKRRPPWPSFSSLFASNIMLPCKPPRF